MGRSRIGPSGALILLLAGCAPALRAPIPESHGRYYDGKTYGTEGQFNPLSQFLNEGFDMLRVDGWEREVVDLLPEYQTAAGNILRSLNRPDRAWGKYGWDAWLRNEILPLTFTTDNGGGGWVPNYEFHLLGSGMVSARMTEWYEQHGVAHPAFWSFVTMTSSHFMNEVVENAYTPRYYDADAATDLLIFDTGGFLLFRSERVQRAFSEKLQLTNWPAQPTWVASTRTLENTGQLFVLRGPLPWMDRYRFLYGFGVTSLFGVSRDLDRGFALSLAAGIDAVDVVEVDSARGHKSVLLRPTGGLYLDRDGSLLVSVMRMYGREVTAYGSDADLSINVYPGIFQVRGIRSPGVWLHVLRGGGVRAGVVARAGIGLGLGARPSR